MRRVECSSDERVVRASRRSLIVGTVAAPSLLALYSNHRGKIRTDYARIGRTRGSDDGRDDERSAFARVCVVAWVGRGGEVEQ